MRQFDQVPRSGQDIPDRQKAHVYSSLLAKFLSRLILKDLAFLKSIFQCLVVAALLTIAAAVVFTGLLVWKMSTEGFSFPGPGHLDYFAHLAGDYWVSRTSAFENVITPNGYSDGTPIIPTVVTACATDGRYILAKRQDTRKTFLEDPSITFDELDPESADYWILDTQKPEVFGPLSEGEFTNKRRQLAIPDSLQLFPPRVFADLDGPPFTSEAIK
jgi:hypothetical protein